MKRSFIINFFVIILFGIIIYRLCDLAIFQRPFLLKIAKKQHNIVIELEPKRGSILDRKGNMYATTVKSPSIYAIPRLISVKDKPEVVQQIAKVLGKDTQWVDHRLARDKAFVWLKRKVSEEEAESVLSLGNPNIAIQNEYKRFYPHSQELSTLLGFCNIDNQGLEGLELSYDKELRGEKGYRHTKRDALGREVPALEEKLIPPINGRDIVLHIDQFIQHVTERELDKSFKQWNAKGAAAVVMDPQTGHILAMATRPSFDANNYQESTVDSRRNRCITDFYEPGSIFKVVTLSSALNENKVTTEDSFFCENGTWRVTNKRTIHDVHPYGRLTVPEILIKSSNIGTVKIAKLLGEQTLYHYIRMFGFGQVTGLGLKGEVPGIVHPLDKWSGISITSVPYGQEVTATSLQMIRAMSAVANGGYLVRPQIIKEIKDEYGVKIRQESPSVREKILDEKVAHIMNDILVQVVEVGTGKSAGIKGIKVAGKTGTSQKIKPGGGYSHTNFIGSFMGFAPAEDPLLAMIVMIDDPHPMYYGGVVAGPVFKTVMEESLLHLGYVPPVENKEAAAPKPLNASAPANPPAAVVHQ